MRKRLPVPVEQYKQIVTEAMELLSPGPWEVTDLVRAREVVNDELCGGYGPDCTTSGVVEWLRSLDQHEAEELIAEINAKWSLRQAHYTRP